MIMKCVNIFLQDWNTTAKGVFTYGRNEKKD